MDINLRRAVLNPNSEVEEVHPQIQSYIATLQQLPPSITSDDPFLMAAKLGRADIVEAIIDALPPGSFPLVARLQDPDGYYATHLAAANGHQEVLRLLLHKDSQLCHQRDRKGWTPLHKAISNSWVPVMMLILHSDFTSIRDLTSKNETCLHVAVKHKRCKEFKVILEHMTYPDKEQLLNHMDEEGNIIFHIAVSDKLLRIVEMLVDISYVQKNINSENVFGLKPLNLCDRGTKDPIIEKFLHRAGAQRSVSLIALIDPFVHSTTNERNLTLILPSGVAIGALQILGHPFDNSASQSAEPNEPPIVDMLIRPGHSFWKFYGALSLTILFLISTLVIVLSLWSVPTSLPLIILVPFLVIYYFIALASNMSDLSIICGSLRIQSIYLVWVGFFCFFITVTIPMILGSTGKKLKSYFRDLNRKQPSDTTIPF